MTYYSHIYPKGGREMLVVMKQKEGELVSRTIDVSVKDSAIKKAVELRDDEIERSDQWSWDYRLAPSLKASAPNKK
jgi:macrodomain Ter protein organizer (MatP/YcbG family)